MGSDTQGKIVLLESGLHPHFEIGGRRRRKADKGVYGRLGGLWGHLDGFRAPNRILRRVQVFRGLY